MYPEIILNLVAIVILIIDSIFKKGAKNLIHLITTIGVVSAFIALILWTPQYAIYLGGRFALDSTTWWFKVIFLLTAIMIVLLSFSSFDKKTIESQQMNYQGEYYSILLLTISGMLYLISSRDLITLYVSLELATIPLFLLAAIKRKTIEGVEAGMKYIVLGALASALLLYGLGLLYALSGSMDLIRIGMITISSPLFLLAASLITAGIGFKLTIVPFHMWAADVYQGAPTPVTAYLSVASKGTGLAFAYQLFFSMLENSIAGWVPVFAVLSALTMTLGNLVAMKQDNIKRFMAFSSISQAGYLLMGFMGSEGKQAMLFYLLIYVTTNLLVFSVIICFSNQTGKESISDYRGLSKSNPMIALCMMLGVFSLAGIPPLSGFVGKFFLFSIASKAGYHWLVVVAALNCTISLYYYLRIVKQLYIESPLDEFVRLKVSPSIAIVLVITLMSVLLLGILPQFYQMIRV